MKKVEVIKGEGLLGGGRNGIEVNLTRIAAYCRVSTDSEVEYYRNNRVPKRLK